MLQRSTLITREAERKRMRERKLHSTNSRETILIQFICALLEVSHCGSPCCCYIYYFIYYVRRRGLLPSSNSHLFFFDQRNMSSTNSVRKLRSRCTALLFLNSFLSQRSKPSHAFVSKNWKNARKKCLFERFWIFSILIWADDCRIWVYLVAAAVVWCVFFARTCTTTSPFTLNEEMIALLAR